MFNWAVVYQDGDHETLLERNPLRGYKVPKAKNPNRVVLSDEDYRALLGVAMEIDWRFHVALVLAHETGHRIGAIRQLRCSDIDLEKKLIHWPAETEKTGYKHTTRMTADAKAALELARSKNPGIGDAPVFPAPKDCSLPMGRHLARSWCRKAEREAGLEREHGRGWHSLRRKFASDLKDIPLKTLQELGGWKTHQTILMCYQHADEDEMTEALENRRTGT